MTSTITVCVVVAFSIPVVGFILAWSVTSGSDSRAKCEGMDSPSGLLAARVLILLGWTYSLAPSLLAILQNGRTGHFGVSEQAPPSAIGSRLSTLLSAILVAVCIYEIIIRSRHRPAQGIEKLVAFVLPWLAFLFIDLNAGQHIPNQTVVYPILGVALWVISPPLRAVTTLAWLTIATAVLSILLGLSHVGLYENPGGRMVDKAIFGSQLLAGPYSHPNLLGAVLALGSPALVLLDKTRTQVAGFGVIGFALVWGASRTSIAAFAVVVLLYGVSKRQQCLPLGAPSSVLGFAKGKITYGRAGILMGAALTVITPFYVTNSSGFSNRGQIWVASLAYWRQHRLFGNGSAFYSKVGAVSNQLGPTAFTGHNQLVDLLATGGILAALAVALLFVAFIRQAARFADQSMYPIMFVVALLFQSWLEARLQFSNLAQVGYVTWIPVGIVLMSRDLDGDAPMGPVRRGNANHEPIRVEDVCGPNHGTDIRPLDMVRSFMRGSGGP